MRHFRCDRRISAHATPAAIRLKLVLFRPTWYGHPVRLALRPAVADASERNGVWIGQHVLAPPRPLCPRGISDARVLTHLLELPETGNLLLKCALKDVW